MAVTKPGAASNIGAIPFIRFGEVKNVRSYRRALAQLASRPGGGNTALALYDDNGNVHLQVFQPQASGAASLVYDRAVGRVAPPRAADGTAIKPGTAPFGNAIEPKVLDLIAMVTGQRFRMKHPNAGGPDIVAREVQALEHALSGEVVSPAVASAVRARLATLRRLIASAIGGAPA